MEFFKGLRQNEHLKDDDQSIAFLDRCFEEVKVFVELSSSRLNNARILFRASKKENALDEFNYFKDLCLAFQRSLNEVRGYIEDIGQSKKLDKFLLTIIEIVEKSTKRTIKSKIPLSEINYLKTNSITESDMDWILKKLKNFWVKFLQVYGSLRIDLILSRC